MSSNEDRRAPRAMRQVDYKRLNAKGKNDQSERNLLNGAETPQMKNDQLGNSQALGVSQVAGPRQMMDIHNFDQNPSIGADALNCSSQVTGGSAYNQAFIFAGNKETNNNV